MAVNIITTKTRRYTTQKPPVGSQIDWSHPLSKGFVGCWLMNEGGGNVSQNLCDFSTKGILSNTTWQNSLKGIGTKFNATTSVISCGNSSQLSNLFSRGGTITTLIRVDGNGESATLGGIIATKNAVANNGYILRFLNDGGEFSNTFSFIRFNTIAGFGQWRFNTSRIAIGNTYILSISYDDRSPSSLPLGYIDGKKETITNTTPFSGTPGNDSANIFDIGNRSSDTARTFNGLLGFVYLHNRSLSPSEIQQLYIEPYCFIAPQKRRFILIPSGVVPSSTDYATGFMTTNSKYWW